MKNFAQIDMLSNVIQVIVCDDAEWISKNLLGTWIEVEEGTAGPGMLYKGGQLLFSATKLEA